MSRFHLVAVAVALVLTPGPLVSAATAGGAGLGSVRTSPGLADELTRLDADVVHGAFVHFGSGTPGEHRTLLAAHDLEVTHDFESTANAVYAIGRVADLRALTDEAGAISYMEEDRLLAFNGDTAPWATRARVAQEAVSGGPYYDGAGSVLDGAGIGVAIVDSGINGAHPDLSERVKSNFKIVCSTPALINTQTGMCFGPIAFVDVGNATSDTTSGHGTHVAGIVAGDGSQSTGPYPVAEAAPNVKGSFTGVAPGATLYGYSTGEAISVLYALESWQHVYDNYESFEPRIKVINGSFGEIGGASYNPDSIEAKVAKKLVEEKGVTMVFSAGNEGGAGEADLTSSYCDDPTPGVICVANYDDGDYPGSGNRENVLDTTSSRGLAGSTGTYPDVSAPGSYITSACIRGVQPVCLLHIIDEVRWAPFYASVSGTSMASPHVAGVAALLLQARPDLGPGQLEDALLDTAHKFTSGASYEPDPQNAGQTTSVDKGAGLVDVPAALDALGVAKAGLPGGGGTPDLQITAPADGAKLKGRSFTASGTAGDGTSAAAPAEQLVIAGDGGDFSGPGAVDLVGLTVQESAPDAEPAGLAYRLTVRDAADFGAAASVTLRVTQNVDGRPFITNVVATPSGVGPGAGSTTAAATSVTREGNTISFFVPFANLGEPASGAPGHNVFASSFIGGIVDLAPSPAPGAGADVLVRPMFGKPYTILRSIDSAPPAVQVKVAVDGGPEKPATVTGSSPDYAWSAKVKLKRGTHTLQATLYLNGQARATDTVTYSK